MDYLSKVVVTTSWDDGHPLNLKVADLLTEFDVKGTFYVAPFNKERPAMDRFALQELRCHFEIGYHTLTHATLRKLGNGALQEEIRGGKEVLEDITGTPTTMFCYPDGRYNKRVCQAVAAAGFVVARTTRAFYLSLGEHP